MIKRNTGFSVIELLVTMVILGIVLVGASEMFVSLLRQFKQQGKIAETNIEGIIGLEMLRQDIDSAGYGLPWVVPQGLTYSEASTANPAFYNDAPTSGPTGTNNNPRAILSGNGRGTFGAQTDELVVKASNIARNEPCKKWTYLQTGNVVKTWDISTENLSAAAKDQIIVISPGITDSTRRTLVVDGTTWKTTFDARANFVPDASENRLVYGIAPFDSTSSIRMPFNRADYYITNAFVPSRCAPNTGVLVKAIISHADGERRDSTPLLDCVADMQVVFRLDTDANGVVDAASDDITAMNARSIRDQVKEVRVYILAHEGQKDPGYVHSPTTIYVGDAGIGFGHSFDIGTNVNYRWKLYTLSVKLTNLR